MKNILKNVAQTALAIVSCGLMLGFIVAIADMAVWGEESHYARYAQGGAFAEPLDYDSAAPEQSLRPKLRPRIVNAATTTFMVGAHPVRPDEVLDCEWEPECPMTQGEAETLRVDAEADDIPLLTAAELAAERAAIAIAIRAAESALYE